MQTFLPFKSFDKSAQCLDYRRLGKQRVECKQILQILLNETDSNAWRNHPAARMWRGHEGALAAYGYAICKEWTKRGYKDILTDYFRSRMKLAQTPPRWLGSRKFHSSHRSNLLRKDKEFYSKYKWKEPADLEYIWPV